MANLLDFLNASSDEITMFSIQHFAWLILYFVILILLVLKCRKTSELKLRVSIFILGVVFLALEFLKNFSRHCDADGNWDIRIEHFQFQFCSMPVYLTSIIALLPTKKIFNIGLTFLATYCMIAGLVSVIFCNTISSTNAFIQTHSFFLHGSMFVLGAYLLITKRIDFKLSSFLGAMIVFFCLASGAMLINYLTFHYTPHEATDFFYISPYILNSADFVNEIREFFPYPIYLCGYLFGFSGLGFAFFKLASINFKRKRLSTE